MSRLSTDRYDPLGNLVDGYDYQLQVWVRAGKVLVCAHPARMGDECCNGFKFAGLPIGVARQRAGLPGPGRLSTMLYLAKPLKGSNL